MIYFDFLQARTTDWTHEKGSLNREIRWNADGDSEPELVEVTEVSLAHV